MQRIRTVDFVPILLPWNHIREAWLLELLFQQLKDKLLDSMPPIFKYNSLHISNKIEHVFIPTYCIQQFFFPIRSMY